MKIELIEPVSCPVSQEFGENEKLYSERFGIPGHNGRDYRCVVGTPGAVADDGYVEKIDTELRGFGLHVKVRHNGHATLYAHLSEVLVKVNQVVARGDVIALTGNSGYTTGPHLHFGLQIKDQENSPYHGYVDPVPYFIQPTLEIPSTGIVTTIGQLNIRTSPGTGNNLTGYQIIANQSREYDDVAKDVEGNVWAHIELGWIAAKYRGSQLAELT